MEMSGQSVTTQSTSEWRDD